MGRRAASALLLGLIPHVVGADDTPRCAALTALVEQETTESVAPDEIADLAKRLNAETCGTALTQTGEHEIHCRWSFDYRADTAVRHHERLAARIRHCLDAIQVAPEQGVNHPDSFDQSFYRAGKISLSLSLKDKASLQKSFVFLRVGGE